MNRLEAIKLITSHLSEEDVIIHANGAINRESFYCNNRKKNFYLLGSMGLASSVGLGIAMGKPHQKVFVFDGDGNILMGFGNLAMIGTLKPENFFHFVLDNEVYGTTGNQPTLSPEIDLVGIARASGYRSSHQINSSNEFINTFSRINTQSGPHFILFKVNTQVNRECPRLPFTADQIKDRFLDSFSD